MYEDSELVKKIKSYGILTEEDISIQGGFIKFKGGIGVEMPGDRDFWYSNTYAGKRDEITVVGLQDNCILEFRLHDDCILEVPAFNYDMFINKIYNEAYDNEEFGRNLVFYENFIKNMSVEGLIYENEVVLKCSYINVHFRYPMLQSDVTFKIMADNELDGFTMKELVLKVMQRYHMLVFMWQNYDIKNGIINPTSRNCFKPLVYESDWTMNAVTGLKYNKTNNTWMVMLLDIH